MTRRQIELFVRRQVVKAIFGPRFLTEDEQRKINHIVREVAATWMQDCAIVRYSCLTESEEKRQQ